MFSGRIALVTGGGSGIGRAVCRLLARDGARVVAADMNKEAAEGTLKMLQETTPKADGHLALKMDVTDKASVESCISRVLDEYKTPPTLVTNAAGIVQDTFLLQMEEKKFMEVIDVNLKGTFLVTQLAAQAMVDHDLTSGAIVNISSMSGKMGTIGQCNYSSSKAGVIGLTKASATELAAIGVRVNCILPGLIQTPMVADVPEKVVKLIMKVTPMKRLGKPEEVAEVVGFLLSDKSSYMTGACVEVSGGLGM